MTNTESEDRAERERVIALIASLPGCPIGPFAARIARELADRGLVVPCGEGWEVLQ